MGTHYVSHWFDGFAHTHKFDIVPTEDGAGVEVLYSSRRHSEEYVEQVKKKGWRSSISFGQKNDPCVGIFAKAMSAFEPRQHTVNVAVIPNAPGFPSQATAADTVSRHRTNTRNIFVTTDNNTLQELHPDTLQPLGLVDQSKLHPELRGPLSSAHAQRDPVTGDLFNFNLDLVPATVYRIFRVDAATGKTHVLAKVRDANLYPAYIHSLFLTENYVVLCIPSSRYAMNGLVIPLKMSLVGAMLPFDKSYESQWLVVDRRHGRGLVARFSTPASFFFHSVNAFEEQVAKLAAGGEKTETEISLDMVMYDTTDVISNFYYDVILNRNDATQKHFGENERHRDLRARLVRYKYRMPSETNAPISIGTAEESISIPAPHVGELPTINPAFTAKPYRYVYSGPNRGLSTVTDSLCKTDLHTREALLWAGPSGHSPGEAIFVARPGGTDEDDGVLLSVVLDGTTQRSYLLCLDARKMEELGRAEADFAIGMGFHGIHMPVVA